MTLEMNNHNMHQHIPYFLDTFFIYLKVRFSEKAAKIWSYLQLRIDYTKGQLISKANFQAVNSSKKRKK